MLVHSDEANSFRIACDNSERLPYRGIVQLDRSQFYCHPGCCTGSRSQIDD